MSEHKKAVIAKSSELYESIAGLFYSDDEEERLKLFEKALKLNRDMLDDLMIYIELNEEREK